MKNHVKDLLIGYAIGTANIIPGVSGGTFLLIFGIYERVIAALNSLNKDSIITLLKAKLAFLKEPGNTDSRKAFFDLLKKHDILFLGKLLIGAGIALVTLSSLLELLLENYQTPTYGLFFGLILVSLLVPLKLFKNRKVLHVLPFILGVIVTAYIALQVDPVEKLKQKSTIYEQRLHAEQNGTAVETEGTYTVKEYTMAAVSGAVAISAMVLPGISGSLVLILLGQYFIVLTAINGAKTLGFDHFIFLGAMAGGMVIGLLLFVRLVNFVFAKFHDGTMAFLTGLIGGSLFALWPFKGTTILSYYDKVDDKITFIKDAAVFTNENILPSINGEFAVTVITILIGIGVMVPFLKHEK